MFSCPSLVTKHYETFSDLQVKKKTEEDKSSIMNSSAQNIKSNKSPILKDKHAKFIENAESRVNDIIVKIERLENLSGKNDMSIRTKKSKKCLVLLKML